MKISVIIPTYGRSFYLKRALFSLTKQTFKEFEVIVIDDNENESENSLSVKQHIKEFEDVLKIRYMKTQGRIGSAKARNLGIENSEGEYITFLDDDDLYLPLKLEHQLSHMLENNLDGSLTNLILVNKNYEIKEYRQHEEILNINKNEDLIRYHLVYHLTGTSSIMLKRSVLASVGNFTPIDIGDEFYLIFKVLERSFSFRYLNQDNVICTIHEEMAGLSTSQAKLNGIKSLDEFKNKYRYYLNDNEENILTVRRYISEIIYLRRNKVYNYKFLLLAFKLIKSISITKSLYKKYNPNSHKKRLGLILMKNKQLLIN